MSSELLKCSVCGGNMKMLTAVASKLGRMVRYKCTCGHCEDIKEDPRIASRNGKETLVLDGFEELP